MKSSNHTFASLIAFASERFATDGIGTANIDARLLMEGASGLSHSSLISNGSETVPADVCLTYQSWMERRISGEPVNRILGYRDFYGRKFTLSPETLVPRDDTELLVETVLENSGGQSGKRQFLEIGTGSGIIAVTLACEVKEVHISATDISDDALRTAAKNAHIHDVANQIEFRRQDVFDGLSGMYHAIVSNPPYIATTDIEGLSIEVKNHDPAAALDGGADGLLFYRAILDCAHDHLLPEGQVFLEVGMGQADAVKEIAQTNGFTDITIRRDYSGISRVVSMCRASR